MTTYRNAPATCPHTRLFIDWMTPALGNPRRPSVMWIERCLDCGHESEVPFPPRQPTLRERIAAWWKSLRG